LVLSHIAYREASARVDAAHKHLAEVERLYKATVETLAVAVDAKDQVTHGHIRRVQRHAMAVARKLGLADGEELRALESAALLHDVGKLAMPDYVLNKPGTLTHGEYETIKQHATKGATILNAVEFPYPVVPTVRHHHEWWNGRGYPDGLAGEAIPLGARILAVVDCFDALTSDRPYRRRLRDEDAIQMLRERSGIVYDPRIVDGFINLIPELRREDERIDGAQETKPVPTGPTMAVDPLNEPSVPALASESVMRAREAARATMEKLIKLFPRAEACLFAVTQSDDMLVRVIATPLIEGAIADVLHPVGQGLSGWVAANRHSIVNSDPGLDLGEQATVLGLHSAAATPVFAFGTVVAVLTVYMPERGAFSERQARVIGVLAQEIGNELVHLEAQQYHKSPPVKAPAAPLPFAEAGAARQAT
jgi:putative nucleotidyltransferase with HDIG domain